MARPASGAAHKSGKKNRKWNRNRKSCEQYRAANRKRTNKLRKLKKHIRLQPNDQCAAATYEIIFKNQLWGSR